MRIKLDNWCFAGEGDGYTPPELLIPVLSGKVYGHPKHTDGKVITTSKIMGQRDGCVVTYSGSEYELLTVDPQYEAVYPNAKERLFQNLTNI